MAQRSRDGLCYDLIACVPASRGRGVLIIVGIQFRIYYILGCRTSMSIVVCRAVDAWRHVDHMDHGLLSSAHAPGSQGSGRPDPAHRALIRLNSLPPFTVRQRPLLLLSNSHDAHDLRTPKHEGLYRNGRRCGRHNLLLHRPLIGGIRGGAASPSRVNR